MHLNFESYQGGFWIVLFQVFYNDIGVFYGRFFKFFAVFCSNVQFKFSSVLFDDVFNNLFMSFVWNHEWTFFNSDKLAVYFVINVVLIDR